MTSAVQKPQSLTENIAGATLASYAIVTGAIAVVCIGAVTYLNFSTEKRVQDMGDKAGATAVNKGSASLGGEVAKSTAVMGGVEMPFQFGLPLFSLPPLRKKDKGSKSADASEQSCPGGKCGKGESSCFVAGTLVLTPTGYRKIEDIRVGDEVLSVPEDSPWASPDDEAESLDADAEEGPEVPVSSPPESQPDAPARAADSALGAP